MQDGASIHTAKIAQTFLKEQGGVVEWPPYSPDLNPIKNLWAILKRVINWRYLHLLVADDINEAKEKFVAALQEVWNEIADELLAGLSDTMSNRRDAVEAADG